MERVDGTTPNGGDYSELHFLNDRNDEVEKSEATHCVIRECKWDGTLVGETWAIMESREGM